ncbi:MAG: hypothetical protein NC489_10740 [Ruminococcus flavefaciens]|nr:hypothetical protein [Ruminococcus flavefaciens]
MIDEETARAYTEIWELLQVLGDDFINRVPEDILRVIEENRDTSYVFKITSDFAHNMSRKGIVVFAVLNLNYWATPEERERLSAIYERNEREYKLRQYENMLEEEDE